jgi:hypothetical protein
MKMKKQINLKPQFAKYISWRIKNSVPHIKEWWCDRTKANHMCWFKRGLHKLSRTEREKCNDLRWDLENWCDDVHGTFREIGNIERHRKIIKFFNAIGEDCKWYHSYAGYLQDCLENEIKFNGS